MKLIDMLAERKKLRAKAMAKSRIIGARLRKKRQSKGLTVVEMARRLGYQPEYVTMLERGDRLLSNIHIQYFMTALEANNNKPKVKHARKKCRPSRRGR